MVYSTRGRPRYAALSGCTNATMMPIASLPGQKIFFTFSSLAWYSFRKVADNAIFRKMEKKIIVLSLAKYDNPRHPSRFLWGVNGGFSFTCHCNIFFPRNSCYLSSQL